MRKLVFLCFILILVLCACSSKSATYSPAVKAQDELGKNASESGNTQSTNDPSNSSQS